MVLTCWWHSLQAFKFSWLSFSLASFFFCFYTEVNSLMMKIRLSLLCCFLAFCLLETFLLGPVVLVVPAAWSSIVGTEIWFCCCFNGLLLWLPILLFCFFHKLFLRMSLVIHKMSVLVFNHRAYCSWFWFLPFFFNMRNLFQSTVQVIQTFSKHPLMSNSWWSSMHSEAHHSVSRFEINIVQGCVIPFRVTVHLQLSCIPLPLKKVTVEKKNHHWTLSQLCLCALIKW